AHDKLQSIKNAWSKDEICCLEMAALLTQGNSESDKYRFNTAFLTGSDYYRYPMFTISYVYRFIIHLCIIKINRQMIN
ncbi:MAG: hypothetical protein SPI97_03670, partial [Oscillospiraceae bacterium]|nr:hypothetical protein [Oscillospiraceae bacterium]